jgi:ATP-dependent helicase HrpB
LPRADPLANAPLLAVAALEMKAAARIRLAAPLDPEILPAERITEHVETSFDPGSGAVLSRRRRRFGALVLSDRTEPADPVAAATVLAQAAATAGLRDLRWTDEARQLQARVALMRQLEPDAGWPDLSDQALIGRASEWLVPQLAGMSRLRDLAQLDPHAILRGVLPRDLVRRLDVALPVQLELPGAKARIDYTQPVPVVSARAQAFYGMVATPVLADGRIPLQLALLSPAGRPVAVTTDLTGFWRNGWADVRRDMRGRYPKHPWPEDPSLAATKP